MNYKNKVEGLYEGFVYDLTGEDYYFNEHRPKCNKQVIACIKRALDQLDRVANQTEKQSDHWTECIRYVNSL